MGRRVVFSAYDHAETVLDAVKAYARCRTAKSFILNDGSRDLARYTCTTCGGPMNVDPPNTPKGYSGNRVEYSPKTKSFRITHYTCGWGVLLDSICTSGSVAEAGRKYAAATVRAHKAPTPRKSTKSKGGRVK